jgi:photosystem II stability/assembly factor-like uncharacterized protein
MATTREISAAKGDVLVMVGTMKGAWIYRAPAGKRGSWEAAGPFFQGEPVYAMAYDGRAGRQVLWASSRSWQWGARLFRSDDWGKSWKEPERNVKFPEDTKAELKNIWQIAPGRTDEPDAMWCGVEPGALFESRDGGNSWDLVRGLWDHPTRPRWEPGGGGLCMHTIVLDPANPRRMWTAVSTGGVFRTDDGGATWEPRSKGIRAQFLPEDQRFPEWGQCVHKVVQHETRPGRLFAQNHWGLYRSDDGGDSWVDIANGVPSDFGFAMAMHPNDPSTVYIVPIESDGFRATPEAKMRVYRTRDAGASWEPLWKGLPQEGAYELVLRDSMATDACAPAGVYFGTRSGKVFGSADDGDTWSAIADGLPPVTSVKAAVV